MTDTDNLYINEINQKLKIRQYVFTMKKYARELL